jgi:hypothetical protein
MHVRTLQLTCVLAVGWGTASPAYAQRVRPDTAVPGGTVLGTILDAGTGQPLPNAVVLLEPRPGGVLTVAGSGAWASGLSQVTDALGAYRFSDLAPGEYRLLVRRIGYHPAVVDVDLRQTDPLRLSVGMTVQPIWLEPAAVTASRAPFVLTAETDSATLGRADLELFRQDEYLESDTRALTAADVTEALTLGETDLLRALHRFPGVSTRDDYTAELWTRGAPWSQTRVYFDGMPLFNPLHTVGVFSGFSPDAVGAAFFHPGGRSAALGEGAAAVLDLTSRPARGTELGGAAELSLVSARLALDGPLGNRAGWTVAGRRSYVDLATELFSDSAGQVPYAFHDVAGRVDVPFDGASALEVSALWEQDVVRGTVRDLLRDNQGSWGNAVVRASFTAPAGAVATRHTLGVSRFAANVTQLVLGGAAADTVVPSHQDTENGITTLKLAGSLEAGGPHRWIAGYELTALSQRYAGPPPRPYPEVVDPDTLTLRAQRVLLALWTGRRWMTGRFALDVGLRAEVPGDVANAPTVGLAPRVTARYAVSPSFAASAAYARTYQYTQALAPAGPAVGPDLHVSDVWLMANDTLPALRSDLITLGAEAWLGAGWLGGATVYGRRTTGIAVADPRPGSLSPPRPLFVPATGRAAGFELTARRLMGRVTGSIAYSEGIAVLEAAGWTYPSSADRRRVLDVTALVRLTSNLRAGGALTAASGAPYTRFVLGSVPCDTTLALCADTLFATTAVQDPNANRTAAYVGLDLLGEWHHAFRSWAMTVFVQLRNVLNRANAVTYVGSFPNCTETSPTRRPVGGGVCDGFDRGLPLLPLVGVSVRF